MIRELDVSAQRWRLGPVKVGRYLVRLISCHKVGRGWTNACIDWADTCLNWHELGLIELGLHKARHTGTVRFVIAGRYHFYVIEGKPTWHTLRRIGRELIVMANWDPRVAVIDRDGSERNGSHDGTKSKATSRRG